MLLLLINFTSFFQDIEIVLAFGLQLSVHGLQLSLNFLIVLFEVFMIISMYSQMQFILHMLQKWFDSNLIL